MGKRVIVMEKRFGRVSVREDRNSEKFCEYGCGSHPHAYRACRGYGTFGDPNAGHRGDEE